MTPIDILLVEDNEGDILLTTEALEEGKIARSIFVLRDGWEALNFLLKKGKYSDCNTPDLVLLDINLPKLNGHEVLKQLKIIKELRHLPVIVLSTSSSGEDVVRSYQNLASCYISKPIDSQDFVQVILSIKEFWNATYQLPKAP